MRNEPNEMAISEFKATCLKVLEQVRRTGQEIIVTKRGRPIALISPAPTVNKSPAWLGSLRDRGRINDDIVSPASDETEWEALS